MRRIEGVAAAIIIAVAGGWNCYNLSIVNKRSVKPAIFHFSTICLVLFLIITISSLVMSSSLLRTIHGQEPDNDTAPPDVIFPGVDTAPPDITVPDDITVEATSPNGSPVQYAVTAEDDVDGTAVLEQDGSTVTQDDVGGSITISCGPPSGFEFPIGNTSVECTATDASGNEEQGFFAITVAAVVEPQPTTDALTVGIISNGTEGVAPSTIKFQANTTGGTEPYTISWDFDDGSEQSDEQTVLHTFEEARSYNVTLAVTDTDDQGADDSIVITVNEPPRPSNGLVILLVVLVSIIIGGIALGKYRMNRRSSRRIKIPPSAIVEIRAKGGIGQ